MLKDHDIITWNRMKVSKLYLITLRKFTYSFATQVHLAANERSSPKSLELGLENENLLTLLT